MEFWVEFPEGIECVGSGDLYDLKSALDRNMVTGTEVALVPAGNGDTRVTVRFSQSAGYPFRYAFSMKHQPEMWECCLSYGVGHVETLRQYLGSSESHPPYYVLLERVRKLEAYVDELDKEGWTYTGTDADKARLMINWGRFSGRSAHVVHGS